MSAPGMPSRPDPSPEEPSGGSASGSAAPEPALPRPREGRLPAAALLAARGRGGGPIGASQLRAAARERERCERFERAVRAHVAGELPPAEVAALRAHLAECASCTEVRRDSVETLARLGRGLRRARAAKGPEPARTLRRRSVLVFVAAAAAFLAAVASGALDGADPRLWARASGPGSTLDGVALDLGARVGVHAGATIEATPGAAGAIESSRGRVSWAGAAHLRVESVLGPRVRVLAGRVEADGRVRVLTPHGVLELEGAAASVDLDGGRARVELLRGDAAWTDALGSLPLTPGQPLVAPRLP